MIGLASEYTHPMQFRTRGPVAYLSFVDSPRLSAGITLANRGSAFGPFGFAVTPTVRHGAATVAANRQALARLLGLPPESLVLQRQVHGVTVSDGAAQQPPMLWRALGHRQLPESDILISDRPFRALLLSVADCCPVLLFDPVVGAIAAAHAGWRGTAAGAAGEAVRALRREYGVRPAALRAWVGPCAGRESYEVGSEVVEALRNYPDCMKPSGREGHALLDLVEVNRRQLLEAGVEARAITVAEFDTIRDRRFHSYRREGPDSGRMAAWIALRG